MSCLCGSCAAGFRDVEVEVEGPLVEEWIVDRALLQPDGEEGSVY
jgi:hypothetical protein